MSAIDDLIAFARGLIPAGVTDSEEVRRLETIAAEVKAEAELAIDATADEVWRERVDAHQLALVHLADARADAERVRRGARCLRERCRRLEARARMAEETHRAHIEAACERGRRFREALAGVNDGER